MKIIKPSAKIEYITPDALTVIEQAARNCYQSEPKGNPESFVRRLINKGHLTPLEMASMRVRIVCDRGVMAELTRHRLASFNVESTRYCRYSDGITMIDPCFFETLSLEWENWESACLVAEAWYLSLLDQGVAPEQARTVLPNSTKTEIVMSANLREWMHIFDLRCSEKSHPQMREIMIPLRDEARELVPVVFDHALRVGSVR